MIRITGLRARFVVFALVVFALCSFILVGPYKVTPAHLASPSTEKKLGRTSEAVLTGHAIAPKLENATAKYVHHGLRGHHTDHTRQADKQMQGRTRSRRVESPTHNLRSFPRKPYRRGARGAAVICTSVPTPIPLVCLTLLGVQHIEVTR